MAHNLADLFEHAVDAYGADRLAVVEDERRLTYADLEAEANRWASALSSLGVGAGDHVGVHLRNGVDCLALILGVLKLRAVTISINYRYSGPELRYLYDYSDTSVLVFHREFGAAVTEAVSGLDAIRHTIVVEDGSGVDTLPDGALPARETLDAASAGRPGLERSGDDLYLVFTGGTTGKPKGVMWRQEDLWRSLGGGADYHTGEPVPDEYHQSKAGLGGDPLRYLILLPLIHTSGIMPSFTGLFAGGTMHYLPHFRAADVLEEIESEKIQVAVVAGDAMVRPLVDQMRRTEPDTSSMFMVSSGAALFSPSVKADLLGLRPDLMIMDAFGSSESGFGGLGVVTKANLDDGSLFSDHGPRIPRGTTLQLVDDLDEPLPDDSAEIGWIVKSGYQPSGYYKDEAKSAETFREVAGSRRVFTGDRGRYDGPDTIIMLGRASQVINSGGEKIFAEEVEAALKAVAGIEDAVVFGVPDERFGHRVGAVVQWSAPSPDGSPASPDSTSDAAGHPGDLDAVGLALREHLAGFKIPVAYWVVDRVERHPSSKTDYGWARRLVAERAPDHDRRTDAAGTA
ncbi:AMP-binding protein [Dietzia psychralcaliphila]|uniref:Acyl-CoA synthetase n=1 Tax=Dietzia psychralcaliphila TaxID=139021 RepID=A0AAD0JSS7_9ACTN|nr:AMP-binding protein [Dietzia psychralcaliphila]AWH96199.1 acyl-CoA synthetase [Dietzia psychralcaliphila]PTM90734.1 fatty-acyl-CoA synthase [Dietzia psychralcaliphila]